MNCNQCKVDTYKNVLVNDICLCPKCCYELIIKSNKDIFTINNIIVPDDIVQQFKKEFTLKILPQISEAYESGTVCNSRIGYCRTCLAPQFQGIFDPSGEILSLLNFYTKGHICHTCVKILIRHCRQI